MKDILCPKTNTPCPAKVLIAELEDGELRDDNIDGNPNGVPKGEAAENLAKAARDLLDQGDCSVGPEYEPIDELGHEDPEEDYRYSLESCTNSNSGSIDELGNKSDVNLTHILTDLPTFGVDV